MTCFGRKKILDDVAVYVSKKKFRWQMQKKRILDDMDEYRAPRARMDDCERMTARGLWMN